MSQYQKSTGADLNTDLNIELGIDELSPSVGKVDGRSVLNHKIGADTTARGTSRKKYQSRNKKITTIGISIRIEDTLYQEALSFARSQKQSFTKFVIQAIEAYLENHGRVAGLTAKVDDDSKTVTDSIQCPVVASAYTSSQDVSDSNTFLSAVSAPPVEPKAGSLPDELFELFGLATGIGPTEHPEDIQDMVDSAAGVETDTVISDIISDLSFLDGADDSVEEDDYFDGGWEYTEGTDGDLDVDDEEDLLEFLD